MASASGKKSSVSRASNGKSTSRSKSTGARKTSASNTRGRKKSVKRNEVDIAVKSEVMLIIVFAVAIFAFLCVINLIHGAAAEGIREVMFGIFGLMAYLIPVIVFLGFAFCLSNKGNTVAVIKLVSAVVLVFLLGIVAYMIMGQEKLLFSGNPLVKELYSISAENHAGGGVLFGSVAHGLYSLVGFGGTLFVVIVLGIISIVFITEKSFLSGIKRGGSYIIESAREDAARMREYRESLAQEEDYDDYDEDYDEEEPEPVRRPQRPSRRELERQRAQEREREREKERERAREKEKAREKSRRLDKKARGVVPSAAVTLKSEEPQLGARQNMHEIMLVDENDEGGTYYEDIHSRPYNEQEPPAFDSAGETEYAGGETETENAQEYIGEPFQEEQEYETEPIQEQEYENAFDFQPLPDAQHIPLTPVSPKFDEDAIESMPEPVTEDTVLEPPKEQTEEPCNESARALSDAETIAVQEQPPVPAKYVFPPIELLKKGEERKGDSSSQLKETALRLQQTLQTFGVKVTITDISQGPSVTRYEMQPEQGVKVSKIVGLADDIKLNLAATDIRIEAPIPGKAAVGIEVPNKETSPVAFRDLLESDSFKNFKSNLCFAVGKDIAGQVVVTDIAKMPHVLIAGATGSGKSVCINTIIMSILYKANPADVKLIMIDPKVVELSVYNGIPHLMIPVVTDPKKASAALHWGVVEMEERYKKFADLNVRDLAGYNKAAEEGKLSSDGEPLKKMPQILIIVDELADLMMVASGEVEESICRLAQLARACGIHLVIATQRPSVDVITGLIKANMPSRIAFSVSSGVDSRTILDMNGAEKLLGKGDMLFYPQGLSKPTRVQGAFVSDSEVSNVVDFLKNQMLGNISYDADIENKIKNMQGSGAGASSGGSGGAGGFDAYFAEAGKFVIEKDKASIGMLQRVFKIGFNRAARIMDQLEEAGVVGAEEGTKPRKILMSLEQFENYIEENA